MWNAAGGTSMHTRRFTDSWVGGVIVWYISTIFFIYLLITCELSNLNHVLSVVSQNRVSVENRTYNPHANSLAQCQWTARPLYYLFIYPKWKYLYWYLVDIWLTIIDHAKGRISCANNLKIAQDYFVTGIHISATIADMEDNATATICEILVVVRGANQLPLIIYWY